MQVSGLAIRQAVNTISIMRFPFCHRDMPAKAGKQPLSPVRTARFRVVISAFSERFTALHVMHPQLALRINKEAA